MDYKQWVTTTPHPTHRHYWAVNIDWDVPIENELYLGSFQDEGDADGEAYSQVRERDIQPLYDLHSELACWQIAIDDGIADEEEARELYDEYLAKALAPDAPGMDKWMAEKQAEHFGTDAGVGDPPEGNG